MSDNKFKSINEFTKCAPNIIFDKENYTCFTFEQLIKMAESYNNSISGRKKKIILDGIQLDKKYLLKELIDKLPKTCNSQECLLKEDFIVDIDDFDLKFNTLRPLGPTKKTKWLSSSDINQIMVQYTKKYDDYAFFGALPIDFEKIELPIDYSNLNYILSNMYKDNRYKIGFVLNLDKSNQSGSHWVALYSNLKKKEIYFFDSYGLEPKNEIIKLMTKIAEWINKNISGNQILYPDNYIINFTNKGVCNDYEDIIIKYNTFKHQFKNSECGVYSINFILRLLKGDKFKKITEEITLDDDINKCREIYFRFD